MEREDGLSLRDMEDEPEWWTNMTPDEQADFLYERENNAGGPEKVFGTLGNRG